MYLRAILPTPILSEKDFSKVMPQSRVLLDNLRLFRPLEMIAFKDSIFKCVGKYQDSKGNSIFQITYEKYPSTEPLYIDARCVVEENEFLNAKKNKLPSVNTICENLRSFVGLSYIWGGNFPYGIEQMLTFYPLLTEENIKHRTFQGLDCSGLLYYVTNGFTPRNTSQLKYFGRGLDIEGLSETEIISQLKPLDIVVWHGHVFCILDAETTIESRVYRGCVYLSDIRKRFKRIFDDDKVLPSNDPNNLQGYVIRRWHSSLI